jgi:hypothetical protein
MKNKNQIQQGDVVALLIDKLPGGLVPRKRHARGAVLAEGEHHGHYHACGADGVDVMDHPDGRTFLVNNTNEPQSFTHEEHKPVVVPPNSFAEFGIVQEYDWFAQMQRNVID